MRNPDWWGGQTPLDSVDYTFFDDLGAMLTGMTGGAVDGLVQFSVIGGDALLNNPDFKVLEIQSATHRQIWMRCDTGQFADKRVRQALALTFDRDQMLETLFRGRASKGNDHVIAPFFPYFDASVPQREQDIAAAQQLLVDAGVEGLQATLQIPNLQEIPDLAQLVVAGAARGRHHARDRPGEHRDVLRHASGARPSRPTLRARAPPSWASSTTVTVRRPTSTSTRRSRRTACGTPRSTPTRISTPPSPSSRARSTSPARRRRARSSRPSSTRTCPSGCRSSTTSSRGTRTHSRAYRSRRSDRCSYRRRHKPERRDGPGAAPLDSDGDHMTAYVLRRVMLSIVTLFLLVTLVFLITTVFPSDPGRTIAGPFAPQETVDAINEQLGTDDPKLDQYGRCSRAW